MPELPALREEEPVEIVGSAFAAAATRAGQAQMTTNDADRHSPSLSSDVNAVNSACSLSISISARSVWRGPSKKCPLVCPALS